MLCTLNKYMQCMQVYAISDKAKDVRGVVMRLNEERGERQLAAVDLLPADAEAAAHAADQVAAAQLAAAQQAPWTDFMPTQASWQPSCGKLHASHADCSKGTIACSPLACSSHARSSCGQIVDL